MRRVKRAHKTVATLTIHNAGTMTPEGRTEVAAWLMRHAVDLVADGQHYADRFQGHYRTRPEPDKAPYRK